MEKYLYYKKKYLMLKKNGGSSTDKTRQVRNIEGAIQHLLKSGLSLTRILSQLNSYFKNLGLEPEEFKSMLQDSSRFRESMTVPSDTINYQGLDQKTLLESYPSLIPYLTDLKENCSFEKWFSDKDSLKVCNNITLISGSCGEPSVKRVLSDREKAPNPEILGKVSDIKQLHDILNAISVKFEGKESELFIGFIVGGSRSCSFKTSKKYIFIFDILPSITYPKIETIFDELVKKIEDITFETETMTETVTSVGATRVQVVQHLQLSFPLDYINVSTDDIIFLNKIIELTHNNVKVSLINAMCGSCFPSFYYLNKRCVQENFEYSVCPAQGINGKQDTPTILKCGGKDFYFGDTLENRNVEGLVSTRM